VNVLIASAKESAKDGMYYFLRNFSKVPDERLHWSPTPTAKTPLRIASHTALYAGRFAKMINEQKLPAVENMDEWLALRNSEEAAITSRVEMEDVFRSGTDAVLAALDSFPEALLESTLDSGLGWSVSAKWLIQLPGWHATVHLGQIDFLQTCWDDQEIYVG